MMHRNTKGRGGFIAWIFLIVGALIVLGLYGFDLKEYLEKGVFKEYLWEFWNLLRTMWNTFVLTPLLWLWEKIQK